MVARDSVLACWHEVARGQDFTADDLAGPVLRLQATYG